jgi:hypothetical protein
LSPPVCPPPGLGVETERVSTLGVASIAVVRVAVSRDPVTKVVVRAVDPDITVD